MLEIIWGVAVCVIMAKIASAEGRSAIIWFCITFVLCVLAAPLPLPFLRFLIAGVVAFVAMFACKAIANLPEPSRSGRRR